MERVYEGALERIRFSQGELRAFKDDEGRIWVQAKPVAEALGLRWHGQLEHLQRDEALRDTVRIIRMVSPNPTNPQESIERETVFIERQGLVLWLAKLQPSRVKDPERRRKIVAYQKEAGKALEDYFFRGAAVNPRAVVDPTLLRTVVSEAVARALGELGGTRREVDPALERLRMAKELLDSARKIPGIDPRWLERCHELVLHEMLGRPFHGEKLTVDLSEFMCNILGRHPTRGELISFGRFLAELYRREFGRSPSKRLVLIEGRERPINSFTREDLPFLERAICLWAESKGIPVQKKLPVFDDDEPGYLN